MTDSQEELREAQARIKELEQQNRMLELRSKLYTQERKMLSANVAVGVVNAFRDTARKEDIKVREALEEAVVDWLAKHDALDGIDLKAAEVDKTKDADVEKQDEEEKKPENEDEEQQPEWEKLVEAAGEGTQEREDAQESPATLPMPRPDYNL